MLGKEVKRGATAQLLYVCPGGEDAARVDAALLPVTQVGVRVRAGGRASAPAAALPETLDWERPLAGQTALVTGAARGIGAAIASVLARDGAHVVGLDVAAMSPELTAGMGAARRLGADRRHHRPRGARPRSPATCSSSTAASTWSFTTRG